MRSTRRALLALCLACGLAAAADLVVPPASLVLEGVPPIAGDIAAKLRPYGEFRSHGLMSWHPTQREVLVRRRLAATNQVHRVSAPGLAPVSLTDLPDAVAGASYQPTHGDYFVFSVAEGGNEVFRLHRFDISSGGVSPLSPEGERALIGTWNRKGDRLVFTTAMIDRHNPGRTARTTLRLIDPARPETLRTLAKWESGSRWSSFRFSEDGKRLAFLEVVSSNERHVWVMDVATGRKRRVSPPSRDGPVAYSEPWFSRDGRGLFVASDRGSEFRRLVYLDLANGKERVLSAHLRHDVEDVEVSFDAGLIAFVTNEAGASVLRFMDLKTLKELPRPALVPGVIGGLAWRRNSSEIGFHITSARSAGDVFSYDQKEHRLTRWTNGNNPEVNTSEFVEPRVVKWLSFDGLEITGLHYHPPARFTGKRPVLLNIHGGPASQARSGFIGRSNYLVNELGIAIIYPNVRGSLGFGKTFLKLDDGMKREDSVKDIGTLLDWIAQQPDLDASRVIVSGASYGGYMSLASAVHFADRIAGAISVAGISDFVTFLERTESYRRDLRRTEYGDEREPAMRAFLEGIAPLRHADRIAKPLLVVQGQNDPRVPYTEAEQIVAALKRRGTPAWFILAKDEGHGFVKKPNADYLFYATVEFARRTLLAQ
ncbi:MAG: prolyl oligopeptidase family serine peptidase [Usitatibacter sp.]